MHNVIMTKQGKQKSQLTNFMMGLMLLISTMDFTATTIALPSIAQLFRSETLVLKEILTVYFIGMILLFPASWYVTNHLGGKWTLVLSIPAFLASSYLCTQAIDLNALLLARFFQGATIVFMLSASWSYFYLQHQHAEYKTSISRYRMMSYTGIFLGAVSAGLVIEHYSWEYVYYLNFPSGLLAFIYFLLFTKNFKDDEKELQITELFITSLAICFFIFTLTLISDHKTCNVWSVMAFLISLSACICLFYYLIQKKEQNTHFHLLKTRDHQIAAMTLFCAYLLFGSFTFLLPLQFRLGFGYPSNKVGTILMLFGLTMAFFFTFAKDIIKAFGYRYALNTIVGLLLFSMGVFFFISSTVPLASIILFLSIMGATQALFISTGILLSYEGVEKKQHKKLTRINHYIKFTAMSTGVCICSVIIQAFDKRKDMYFIPTKAFQMSFLYLSLIAIFSLWVFTKLPLLKGKYIPPPKEKGKKSRHYRW